MDLCQSYDAANDPLRLVCPDSLLPVSSGFSGYASYSDHLAVPAHAADGFFRASLQHFWIHLGLAHIPDGHSRPAAPWSGG